MNKYLYALIFFVVTFIIIFLYYYLLYIKKNKGNKLNNIPVEISLIKFRNKINLTKINYHKLLITVSVVTSFNLAFIINLVYMFEKNIYLTILYSVLILIPTMFISYEIIGKYFKKKEARYDK